MIPVDHALVSDEIAERFFVCHLEKCKGACCVEGDTGAPLEEDEEKILQNIYSVVKPFLSEEGRRAIEKQGTSLRDPNGKLSTPTLPDGRCVYSITDDKNILKCGIEQAHREGKTSFKKPLSCHLYPIRITKYPSFDAVNYHSWDICKPACALGQEKGVPLYVFLKEALIRKYSAAWYARLENAMAQTFPNESARSTDRQNTSPGQSAPR